MGTHKLSVVIPAFNEERRLPKAVAEIVSHLQSIPLSFEIIVVNDGSTDTTTVVVQQLAKLYKNVDQINLKPNQGKGGAVRAGMLAANGEYVLFTDADQSTPIGEVDQLLRALEHDNFDLAIGSRAIEGATVEMSQTWYREWFSGLFGLATKCFCIRGIADTQCGFKCMKRLVGQTIFSEVTSRSAIFDIEMLIVATRKGFSIAELPVKWKHNPDTRIPYNLHRALKIWGELFRIRRAQRVHYPLRAITQPAGEKTAQAREACE